MIKLIVSDLDGTLLSSHDTIHPDNLAALSEAAARGIRFAAASGRTAASVSRILAKHDLLGAHVIGTNGCEMLGAPYGPPLEEHFLREGAAAEILAAVLAFGLPACLCAARAIVHTDIEYAVRIDRRPVQPRYDPALFAAGEPLVFAGREAIEAALSHPQMKVFVTFREGQEDAFVAAREAVRQIPGISITSSWRDNFEVMPEGVDKGAAVRSLAERLGIHRDEILAFGDHDNDLPMLRYAGLGIAMGNASADLLAAVTMRTGANTEGGVAMAVRRYAVGERGTGER